MRVTIIFKTKKWRDYIVTLDFSNDDHLNNYIAMVLHEKGYRLDEIYKH